MLEAGSFDLGVKGRNPVFIAIFYLALSFIIVGVGFLKPNISTIVGQLYKQHDPRRDSGFLLYYYGINMGAFWSGILCSWLAVKIGWWAGFGLAGIGMAAGWLVFTRGKVLFFLPGPVFSSPMPLGQPPHPERLRERGLGPLNKEKTIYLLGLLGVIVVWGLMRGDSYVRSVVSGMVGQFHEQNGTEAGLPLGLTLAEFFVLIGSVLVLASIAVVAYIVRYMFSACTKIERDRLLLAFVLIGCAVAFWTFFEQAGSSLNQFAERSTQLPTDADPNDGIDSSVSAGQLQSLNAGFILIFAPIFATLWTFPAKERMGTQRPDEVWHCHAADWHWLFCLGVGSQLRR